MKKKNIIKERRNFNTIISQKEIFAQSKFFMIYIKKKESEQPKFGIAVSKKIGNAVVRNKLKRQYRRIIDENILLFQKFNDYIIMIKKASLAATFKEISKNVEEILREREDI